MVRDKSHKLMGLACLLVIVSTIPSMAQNARDTNDQCRNRAFEMVKSLGKGNPLRESVNRGNIGDCVHYDWMDKMKGFGIKHASFLVEYNWKRGSVCFAIKSRTYLTTYYTDFKAYSIKDKVLLKQISESGLERTLGDVVLENVRKSWFAKREKSTVRKDVFQVDLFDDESLPLSYMIF